MVVRTRGNMGTCNFTLDLFRVKDYVSPDVDRLIYSSDIVHGLSIFVVNFLNEIIFLFCSYMLSDILI